MKQFIIILSSIILSFVANAQESNTLDKAECTCQKKTDGSVINIPLKGKVRIVKQFADFKVEVVTNFPDLDVQLVNNFPDQCGEWQIVDQFEDFTIQIVNNFSDFKIRYVKSFPGIK